MKKHIYYTAIAATFLASAFTSCGGSGDEELMTDSTGLPGDNFSLAGALDLFKESKSLEDFEKSLNTKSNKVNNLDLNGDSAIDYIRVIDKTKDDAHAIVMQVLVSKDELQDIAVIEIQKTGKDKALVQIVGNEMLYGDSAVIEPMPDGEGKTEQAAMVPGLIHETVIGMELNVWLWPPVQYIYSPAYVVYVSPVVWEAYPVWFEPWPPYPYGWYRREVAHRHRGYYPVYVLRPNPAHIVYLPYRRNSMFVMNRYQAVYMKHGMPKMKGKPYYGPGAPAFKDHGGGPGFKDHGGPGFKDHGGPGKMEAGGKGGGGNIKMGPGSKGSGPQMQGPSGGGPKGGGGAVKGGGGGKGPGGPSGSGSGGGPKGGGGKGGGGGGGKGKG